MAFHLGNTSHVLRREHGLYYLADNARIIYCNVAIRYPAAANSASVILVPRPT